MQVHGHQILAHNGHPGLSAVAAHAWEGHRINRPAEVLCKEKIGIERKVKESLLIQQHCDNVMNLDKGYDVSKLWYGLFP